ncbi:hypothetical protein [Coleofasciculus sp. E1-EBD-02]|uniref:hypothetical protein n=1 Tax=Coleofasciculus sp. E1-EBD-02 TaxID=3068481 RepID=UPI0032FC4265
MLTIFSIPKPFNGHIGIIQRNAIESWSRLHPACEIILCGNEPGIEEVVTEFGAKWIPSLARNEYGTPLLNSAFDQVQQVASHPLLCYVNADIILLRDFIEALPKIHFRRFLMVGQRWNIDITEPLDFAPINWDKKLREYVASHGVLFSPMGIDFFVFPRDSPLGRLPPFAVGRPGWDNWFIYKTRQLGIPVIDVTRTVTIVHQNHDYAHVPHRKNKTWEGPEADWNRQLMGCEWWNYLFSIADATHIMTSRGLQLAWGREFLQRHWQILPILFPSTKVLVRLINGMINRLLGIHNLFKLFSFNKNAFKN